MKQQTAREAETSPSLTVTAKPHAPDSASAFADNREQAIAQRRLNQLAVERAPAAPSPLQPQKQPQHFAQGGLPAQLKRGVESLSGIAMDDVRVHYNSAQPAQLQALAYAQGSDIHLAPGQERHLPHEAWHVVQQKQGRVRPRVQLKGEQIDDDPGLEREADVMGMRAAAAGEKPETAGRVPSASLSSIPSSIQRVMQRAPDPTIATLHPRTGRPVILNLVDETNTEYVYEGTIKFLFRPLTNEYFDIKRQPIAAPQGFNEDAAPAAVALRPLDTFRGLTFTVDGFNRVTRAAGTIHESGTAAETGRSSGAQMDSWEHVQSVYRSMFNANRNYFNGGHIIAHHLGGSPGTNNMVPMEKDYNQSGEYKQFENNIDAQFDVHNTNLDIQIDVTYATDYADLMNQLVTNDPGGKRAEIDADANVKAMVMRTIGRIPKSIALTHLHTIGLHPVNKVVADPAGPLTALAAPLRSPYNIQNILNTSFIQTGTDREGSKKKTERRPFAKSYGPNKGDDIDVNKDYHADYQSIYADMPRPGITEYIAGNNGLAGGVRAYIWMDPMGIYDRFGGSGTIGTVDPLGCNWPYLNKAISTVTNKGGIYKRGHLLNHELHGPGADSRNLLPITTRANGEMSRGFEEIVKKCEALVNPKKGVLWETEASRTAIVRTPGWNLLAATAGGSSNLFNEEAKLPAYIDCRAWEGIRLFGGIQKGRQIVNLRIQNNHPGDPNGVLSATHSGNEANDAGILPKYAGGNNAVTGHAVTDPVTGDAAVYRYGYEKDHAWFAAQAQVLTLTPNDEKHYLEGLGDIAYDEGYAGIMPPDMSAWTVKETDLYNREYRKGLDRSSFSQGYYQLDHSHAWSRRARDQYSDGRYQRGIDTGMALGPSPGLHNLNDALMRGYFRGMYLRGRKDADGDIQPASQEHDYADGYRRALRGKAFDHGYECEPMHALGKGDPWYEKDYYEGQRRRGYRHGYGLKQPIDGQSISYRFAFHDGITARGQDDGMHLDFGNTGLHDGDYQRAWHRGVHQRGVQDGEEMRTPALLHDDYLAGYDQGLRRRGEHDGYRRIDRQSDSHHYVSGWESGARKVTYDEGYDGVWQTTYPLYHLDLEQAYDRGQYARGKRDALDGWHEMRDNRAYLRGYDDGKAIRRRRQREARRNQWRR